MGKRSKPCPACGQPMRDGFRVYVVDVGEYVDICADCHKKSFSIFGSLGSRPVASAVLSPFAKHLRKLAQAYALDDEGRAEGLRMAAGILESGRAVDVESPTEVKTTGKPPKLPLGPSGDFAFPAGTAPDVFEHVPTSPRTQVRRPSAKSTPATTNGEKEPLTPCARACLDALTRGATSRTKLAIVTGYSPTSGNFAKALGRLRADQLISGDAHELTLTGYGQQAARAYPNEALPTGAKLLEYWVERLGPCAGAILQCVTSAYPNELERGELASRCGYEATSGNFAKALGRVRKNGLLERRGTKATANLMTAIE